MSLAFGNAIELLFADPNLGRDAVYIADGGAPVLVRIVARRADAVTEFGDARLWSETTRIDLRVAEVPNPRPGDRVEIDGDAFLIQGEPKVSPLPWLSSTIRTFSASVQRRRRPVSEIDKT